MEPEEVARRQILSLAVRPIDVETVKGFAELLEAFQRSSIQARNLGKVYQVWLDMLRDPGRPLKIAGLAGPLIAAGLRKVLADAVRWGLFDVVVATGAIFYQDLYQSLGHQHYLDYAQASDEALFELDINRIYDTYVDGRAFELTDRAIASALGEMEPRGYSSREVLEYLAKRFAGPGSLLAACLQKKVPMFCPALTDSSIGIAWTLHYGERRSGPRASLDPVQDNVEFLEVLGRSASSGVVFVGGGTPKNWINDAIVSSGYLTGTWRDGHQYAVQVTTDAPHWGGLSGSSLDEAVSWGKVAPGARTATAAMEASVALPLLVRALYERRGLWDRPRSGHTSSVPAPP